MAAASPDLGSLSDGEDDGGHVGGYEAATTYELEERSPSSRAGAGAGGFGGFSPDEASRNFKVVIRIRPPLPRELHGDRPFQNVVKVDPSERIVVVSENLAAFEESGASASVGPYSTHVFTFDHVYDQHCDQKKVYETTAKSVVESSLKGYNATIFAVSVAPAAAYL